MADLEFRVRTNWQELVELRKQIIQTRQEMGKLTPESSAQEIEALTQKHAALLAKYDSIMASAGRTSLYMKEAMTEINNLIKSEVENLSRVQEGMLDGVSAAEKQLKIEEKINETLRKKRNELKAQITPDAKETSPDAWLANTERLAVYEELLKESEKHVDVLKEKVAMLNDSDYGLKQLESMRLSANDMIDKFQQAVDNADKLENALSNNKGKTLEEIRDGVLNYEQALIESSQTANQAFKSQEEYVEELQEQYDALKEKTAQTTDETELAKLDEQAKELEIDLQNAKMTMQSISDAKNAIDTKISGLGEVKDTINAFDSTKKSAEQYIKILDDIKVGTDEANKAFENYATKTFSLSEEVKGSMKSIAAIAGIGFGIHEVGNFVQQMASTREYFQDIESSMKVFLGNEEKSMEFTKKLKDYAWFNMFEFSDLAKASQQMIAYGQDVESIIPRLDQLSNVASGTHAPLMEMVDAYNRAKSTGVVDANGIKSWATKGVVIKDILKEMGEHAAGTAITFEQLNKVLDHITGEGGMFHNLMAEQLNNISAEKGQLEDNLATMFNEIGEKYQDVITKYYKLQSDMTENYLDFVGGENVIDFTVKFAEIGMDALMENWKALMELIKNAIVIYGTWRVMSLAVAKAHMAYTKVIAANTLAEKINTGAIKSNTIAKGEANAATILLSKSIKGLNGTMLMSPLTWWAAGITAIVYGVYSYYSNMMTADKATRLAASSMEAYNEELESEREKDKELIGVLKDKTASLYEQYKAYQDLIKQRAIFAQYTREELENMSPEQIKALEENDDYSKTQTRLEREIKAYQEIKQIADSVGVLDFSANIPELKERMQEIAKENYLGQEWFEKQWESIHWNTGMGRWADEMIDAVSGQLQEHLQDKSVSGIKGGIENGIADTNIRSLVSNLINSYSGEIANSTADKGKTIAESYKNQLVPTINEVQERITALNKELATASGEKKTTIQAKLDAENTTLEFLRGVMSFFEGGVTNKTLVVEIQQATQEEQVGGDFVKELGDQYAKAELMAAKYKDALIGIQEETENTRITSQKQLDEIAARFGFTAENINHDVGEMSEQVQSEIDDLKEKYDNTSDLIEREKLKVQIEEKEKLLEYISTLQKKLLDIAKSPYTIFLNVAGNAIDFLKGLLGGKGFTMDFGLRSLADKLLGNSKKAQDAASEQRKKDAENEEKPVISSAETYKELKADAEKKKKLYDTILKNDKKNAKTYVTEEDGIYKIVKEGTKGAKLVDDEIKKKIKQGKDQAESAFKEVGGDPKGNKNARKEALQRRQKEYDIFIKNREQQLELAQKAENTAEEERIAGIENAGLRERAERENQFRLRQQQIDNQIEAYKKQNVAAEKEIWSNKPENKNKIWADSKTAQDVKANGYKNISLTKEQDMVIETEKKKLSADRKLSDYEEKERLTKSMQDYLVEYGNYQQKKKAIEDKYNKLIEKAEGNLGEQMRLQAEKRSKQAELDMQNLQKEINWEVVFGNLDSLSTKAMEKLRDKLREALSADNIDPQNAKVLSEKILEIEDKISAKTSVWASMIPYLKERERISNQVALAAEREAAAEKESLKAQADLALQQWNAKSTIQKVTGKSLTDKQLNGTEEEIMTTLGIDKDKDKEKYDAVSKALDKLKLSAEKAAQATGALAQAKQTKQDWESIFNGKRGGFLGTLGGVLKDAAEKGGGGFWGWTGVGAANLGSMGSLAEQLGFSGDDFEKISTGVNDAMGAVTDFASGNYIGALTKGISAINSLGEGIGLWSNSNVAEMEAMIDRLEKSNAELGKALDDLRDEMHNTNLADTDAYERAQRVANAQIENGMRVVWAKMNEYDGHHSTRYYSDYATGILYELAQKAMNAGKIDQKYIGEAGYNTPFGYVGGQEINDILKYLTPADLDAIRSFNPEGWIKFMDALRDADKADLGAADTFLEYVDTYADTLKDLETEWKETLLNLSWDSLKSSFASALEDMEKSVEDWNDDLTDIFKKGVSNYISTKYTDKNTGDLAKWYEKYYEAMNSNGLDVNEVKALREDYLRIVREATAERDNLYRTLGITEQDKQSATFNSAQNITYEQADALVGILTAQLIVQEQGKADLSLLTASVSQLTPLYMEQRDIAADSRDILAGMAIHVEEIRDGVVDTIVPRIKNIDDNLNKVYKLVEAQ